MNYFKDMLNYSKMNNTKYFLLFTVTVLFAVVNGASSYFSKIIIDLVNNKASIELIIFICILIVAAYLIISIFSIYKNYLNVKISNNLDYGIKSYYFDIVQKSTYLNSQYKESSEIYYRMFRDIGLMSSYFINLVITLPVNVLSIFLYVGIMIYWSYKLTIFAVIISIIQIIVSNYNKPHVQKITSEVINNENRFVKEIGEHFRGIETVKTLGLEDYKLRKIKQIIETVKMSKQKNVFVLSVLNFVSGFIGQVGSVGVLLMGSIFILRDEITIGTYVGFSSMMVLLSSSIDSIVNLIFNFEKVKVSYKRYREYFDNYCDYEYEGNVDFKFNNSLEFKNVSFSYENNRDILKDINMILRPGEFVGIMGQSGSGKSTFGKLIMRLIKPVNGEILIDGINIKCFKHKLYKNRVAYLSQVPFIFAGTIKENICIGLDKYDENYLEELLNKTGVSQIINKYSEGINTIIGKDGAMLSVGEAQRICIARVLIKKPSIIILDEPTSALNNDLDELVTKLFKEYANMFNSLVILISHKESSLSNVDVVYEINEYNQFQKKGEKVI